MWFDEKVLAHFVNCVLTSFGFNQILFSLARKRILKKNNIGNAKFSNEVFQIERWLANISAAIWISTNGEQWQYQVSKQEKKQSEKKWLKRETWTWRMKTSRSCFDYVGVILEMRIERLMANIWGVSCDFFQNTEESNSYEFQSLKDLSIHRVSCVMGFRLSITACRWVKIKLQSCTDSSRLQFFDKCTPIFQSLDFFSHDKVQGRRFFPSFFRFPLMLLFTEVFPTFQSYPWDHLLLSFCVSLRYGG